MTRLLKTGLWRRAMLPVLLLAGYVPQAQAEIILSQVIVDLQPDRPDYQDIEIWNSASERAFVQVEPAEILNPGLPAEHRERIVDPEQGGLLVSPQRLVLEPDERRIIRIAAIAARGEQERIYRVAVRPVAGDVGMETTGLKVLLGYDVLVLLRPAALKGDVTAIRRSGTIEFTNNSNFAHEIYDGKQCNEQGDACVNLPSTRLYPGATWSVPLTYPTRVDVMLSAGGNPVRKSY